MAKVEKTYRVACHNRRGEYITATFKSSNRPNTKKWFEELADHELWRGVKFTEYVNMSSDYGEYRAIKAH